MKVEVAILGPNKPTVSVNVKQHFNNNIPNSPYVRCGGKTTLKRKLAEFGGKVPEKHVWSSSSMLLYVHRDRHKDY